MIRRHREQERIVPHRGGPQWRLAGAERGHGQVHLALQYLRIGLLGIHEADVQRRARVQGGEVAQQRRQPVQADVVAGGQAQAAADVLAQVLQGAPGRLGLGQHLPGAWQQGAAGLGQHHLAAEPVEQARLQRLFQRGDALADRRLGQVQLAGGGREAAVLGHGHEGRQAGPVHRQLPDSGFQCGIQ